MRARTEGTLGDSIGSFRRHLSVLERAAPMTVSPANRLRIPGSMSSIPPYRPGAVGNARVAVGGSAGMGRQQRRHAQKRRRDVLLALGVAMAGSALLAMIPGLSIMWMVNVVIDVLFVGYVALLVRMRNVAAEREMKLTFLPAVNTGGRHVSPYGNGHTVAVGLADLARRAN
ncbi:MAG: hypothetical protein M3N98_02260 [Actinomycetota bacterium]|nr:hypothetical protein [Actinomycetota bacterium]